MLIITFQIYNIVVSKFKHVIGPIQIITFNEELEFPSVSIIEIINIDESLHENEIVIFITKEENQIIIMLQRMTTKIALNYTILKIVYIMILINVWYLGGGFIHISILKYSN